MNEDSKNTKGFVVGSPGTPAMYRTFSIKVFDITQVSPTALIKREGDTVRVFDCYGDEAGRAKTIKCLLEDGWERANDFESETEGTFL